jgi:hypothetical protein
MQDHCAVQSELVGQQPAGGEALPLQAVVIAPGPPTLWARVGKYALLMGGISAVLGALEGALIGSLLAPRKDPGTLILVVALDRCIVLGLIGAVFGAAVGGLDWCLRLRKKASWGR